MTPEHMDMYKDEVLPMFQEERKYYTQKLLDSIQDNFDYTHYINAISQKVYGIYGDRNTPEYHNKISDLNLSDDILSKLELRFINDACHMIMIENPKQLYETIEGILK